MLAGLIKTLLYILFFWYGFKLLAKIFAPFLMRYAAKKVQEKYKDQMKQQMEGLVLIRIVNQRKKERFLLSQKLVLKTNQTQSLLEIM